VKLEMDFVRTRRPWTMHGVLLLLTGIAVAGAAIQQYVVANQDIAALEREIGVHARAPGGNPRERQADIDRLRGRILLANQVVRKKTVPWDGLFRDIESASTPKIGLLTVQPDASSGVVRISGEALDAAALTAYIERLEAQPSLANVHLAEHEIKLQQGRPVVRFNLNATWAAGRS
jgi:Tfp pilus assembly protein PilN